MTQPLMAFEDIGILRTGSHAGGCQQKYVLTEERRRMLFDLYDSTSTQTDKIASHHLFRGIPRHKIKHWASALGLARQREPRWTAEEKEFLERNLHKMSLQAIGKHLGRTKVAVRLKAKRIGVNKCFQEGYTMRGLETGLGVDHHKIERWIGAGWLKGRRRQTERTTGDTWYFSDTAIRKFVREHPHEIDPRRADWLWLVDVLVGLGELDSGYEKSEAVS